MKKLNLPKIPLLSIPDAPIMARSQKHLPIAEIANNMVLHKDGGAAVVLESTSLNFGLLSEQEQEAVIATYAALLNSLSFPIQIVVRTQRKDITKYLNYIDEAAKKIKTEKLRGLMVGYRNFITETVTKKNVLGKRFFMVIPFFQSELGVTKSFRSFARRHRVLPFTREYVLHRAKITLYPKRDHIIKQGARLGIRLTQLTNEQLVELYFRIYNPDREAARVMEEEAF